MTYPKPVKAIAAAMALCATVVLPACDETTNIGGSLVEPNVTINVDSSFIITGSSFIQEEFDARAETMLLGALDMEGVGNYSSSVVTQLMAASSLAMPDSITLDSISAMSLKLSFRKGALTGDSLTPCQLKVYKLTKQLPAGIQSSFNPDGYYDPSSPLGVKNYTASVLGTTDSVARKDNFATIRVDMPLSLARDIITRYRTDPSVFQWPQTFQQYFPGLYIENTFGKGCMVNLTIAEMAVYYQRRTTTTSIVSDTVKTVYVSHRDSVTLFSTAPEVLSSNNLRMSIADPIRNMVEQDDKVVIMSPCGYLASIRIPAQEIVDKYNGTDFDMAVINNLVLTIPARTISNNYGLMPAPNLLLVRRSDLTSFFANNQLPDASKKTFYGSYSSTTSSYTFSSMRQYIADLIAEGGTVSEEDMEFVLIPVNITSEYNSLTGVTYLTGCTPYIYQPTLCELNLSDARLVFTFSSKN